MLYKYLPVADIPKYRELLPNLLHPRVARLFTSFLTRFERVLGTSLYWQLPQAYADHKNDTETQRALRITNQLIQAGHLKSSQLHRPVHADEPDSYMAMIDIGGSDKLGWAGKSVHLFDPAQTFWPALGEALERSCTLHPHYPKSVVISSSYADLQKPKIDIFNLTGPTDEQRVKGSRTYTLTYDKNSVFKWIPTVDLVTKEQIYAPLQWFNFSYIRQSLHVQNCDTPEPLLTAPITTGAAAGQTKDDAILAGLLEVIERDAFIIYWLNQIAAKRINLAEIVNEEIQKLLEIATDYRLEVHVLYLETDVPVHTICQVVVDRTGEGPAVMVTAKTGFDLAAMIISLLHDTLGQRSGARNMQAHANLPDSALEPQNLEHRGRMIYWHHPKQLPEIEHFISGKLVSLESLPAYHSVSARGDLDTLLSWFGDNNHQVLCRELISPELKRITEGVSVVMVKVPSFQPVYLEEELRSTAGERLRSIPEHLGYPQPKNGPDPFHKEPHPFP